MIVAIFGRSATGKTIVTQIVARELGALSRHCGEALKKAAQEAGFGPGNAPEAVHHATDEATIEWCQSIRHGVGVVEGRFLDRVMASRSDVLLIELQASAVQRVARWSERLGYSMDEQVLAEMDHKDDMFRDRFYSDKAIMLAASVIVTSGRPATECAERILSLVRESKEKAPG